MGEGKPKSLNNKTCFIIKLEYLRPYVLVVIYLYGGKAKSIHSGSSYLKLVDYIFFFNIDR